MKISTNVSELINAVSNVTRALAVRPAKSVLEGVLLEASQDENGGQLVLTCTDGKLRIQAVINADVTEESQAVLPGKLLAELVRKLPGGDVTIQVSDDFSAQIVCRRSRSRLSGMNPLEFPEMGAMEEGGVTIRIPQNRLKDMITRTVFSVATDENRQVLTGCLLEVMPGEARIVALDGFRLAIQKEERAFELPEGVESYKVIIPGRVMNEMSHILSDGDDDCVMTFDRQHMTASFGQTRLSSVLLAGEYIDYRRILPTDFSTSVLVDRATLNDALDRASLMAREGKNNLVRFRFSEEELTITSKAESGNVEEKLSAAINGEPLDISFNAKYIIDVIRNVTDEKISMQFNSSVSPCVVKPMEGDSFLYLILPVRTFQ